MDNQKSQNNKKGLFSGMGGFSGWISALMGKKTASKTETSQQKKPEFVSPATQILSPSEDSVAQDIQAFKGFVKKTFQKTGSAAKPYVEKGTTSVAAPMKQAFATKFVKRLAKIFLIIFFLMLLVFIGTRLFKEIQERTPGATPSTEATPTPVPYEPYKKSVHADDPEVLMLEEEINILERELSTSSIREDKLTLPNLDFNVSFK